MAFIMIQANNLFCRNSISAELPSNTTKIPSSNFTRDQNETQVTVPDNANLNNTSNDKLSSIDFAENPIDFDEHPIDFAESSDNETGEPFDFSATTTSTSSKTVASTTSTMPSTTSTTSTTETTTTKEFFIARNKASSVLNEIRNPRSYDHHRYNDETLSEYKLAEASYEEQHKEDVYAKYYYAFVWFQIFIFYNILFHSLSNFLIHRNNFETSL